MGNFLLAAINAKYIHSNLAVYSLRAYAKKAGYEAELAEYTINHQKDEVLRDLFERNPAVVGFSCYIWNIDFVKEIAAEFHKICPLVPIWVGGPEVSWNAVKCMEEMPFVTGVMAGEGEETFRELMSFYKERHMDIVLCNDDRDKLLNIKGLFLRNNIGEVVFTGARDILSMDELVFPYENLSDYKNRIIYYETSRGCPFSCSYCLSSIDKKVRIRSLSIVFKELDKFIEEKTAQVKFVDRTFNCRHEHAYAIWQYIYEHDNGVTNFHFEISADLLREEDFCLFEKMRPGLIQLEIGVQTTNPETLKAIGRTTNMEKLYSACKRVKKGGNIHQHLDLIAGLPFEDIESFKSSFDDVYFMKPDQLQLGFLKVLHGTKMESEIEKYELKYHDLAPYEVLSTKWLSYSDVIILKNIEETVEDYYNSGQFDNTIDYVVKYFSSPFVFFKRFGTWLRKNGKRSIKMNREDRYLALKDFIFENMDIDKDIIDELLTYDFCLREKLNRVPVFVPSQEPYKKIVSDFFAGEVKEGRYFGSEVINMPYRQLRGRCQPVVLEHRVDKGFLSDIKSGRYLLLFDYEKRSVLDHNASVLWIPFDEID